MLPSAPGSQRLDRHVASSAANGTGWRRLLRWFGLREQTNYEVMRNLRFDAPQVNSGQGSDPPGTPVDQE
ncbi:MAG: hypothetical protein ACE5GE_08205 [Phycisphaerae bacterium]